MDPISWLRLAHAPGINNLQRKALLAAFGTAEAILAAPREELAAVAGSEIASALHAAPGRTLIDDALAWISNPGNHLITYSDGRYPSVLKEIPDPPAALYVRGRPELLAAQCLAIVGSRNATPQGEADAEAFARVLSGAGLTIVSGMALGIDAAAHRGGLQGPGGTIAVLGTGADRVYPRRNRELADLLAARGALISDFPLGTPPLPDHFPRRNRLISGLSRGVLVVEAARGSGSLLTAKLALDQNRDVFAIPGSIHSPLSKGCHELIREGAKLVETADQVLAELNLAPATATNAEVVEADDDPLLAAMGHAPASVDQLAHRTGRSAASIAARLSLLEIEGRIAALASGLFQRLAARERPLRDRVIE